jgi:hypothetical protein
MTSDFSLDLTPRELQVREAALDYFESPEFDPVFQVIDRYWRPSVLWRYVVAILSFASTIGIPIALYQMVRIVGIQLGYKKRKARFLEKCRRSVPVVVSPLMVNSKLLREPGVTAPGLFMGSFEPGLRTSLRGLDALFEAVIRAETDEVETAEEHEIAALYKQLGYEPHRRRLMPHGVTDGRDVYAFDLLVVADLLEHRSYTIGTIPCLAEPGPQGQIVMMPTRLMPEANPAS